jgi:hypothetical protein
VVMRAQVAAQPDNRDLLHHRTVRTDVSVRSQPAAARKARIAMPKARK